MLESLAWIVIVAMTAACSGHKSPVSDDGMAPDDGMRQPVLDTTGVPVIAPPPFAPVPGFRPPVAATDAISSTFGPRWKWSESRYELHLGIDYYGPQGTPLLAIGPGTVYGVFPDGSATYPNGGNVVVIEHAMPARVFHGKRLDRFYAVYLHTATMLVTTGATVVAGQKVATMGMTGATDFVHLHFETRVGTTCSLEYQLAHPTSSCALGFDPHVHPYLFVGGANTDQIRVEQIVGDDFAVRYTATRGDMDLDVVASDLGTLDFVTRDGLDATSSAHLDNFEYGYMHLVPIDFRSGTELLEIELHFPKPPAYLELRDIYGVGRRYGVIER